MANILNNEDCDDDEFMWIDTESKKKDPLRMALHDLDNSMRCPICSNLLNSRAIPVSIPPCHHTFCSECIRNSLRCSVNTTTKRQALCPVCRCNIVDYNKGSKQGDVFRPNKSIEEVVRRFEGLRQGLCMALDNDVGVVLPQNVLGQQQDSSDCKGLRASKRIKISSTLSTTTTTTTTTSVEQPQQNLQKRSVIAPTHYSILKRKGLVALLNKYNIPTQGSSVQDMRDRHLAFVTLHNADCDATNPRTYKQLVAEVMRRENQVNYEEQKGRRNGASRDVKCMEKWKQGRNSTTTAIATGAVRSGDEKFDQKCKDGFDKLIQDAKKRKQETEVGEKQQAQGSGSHAVHDHKEKEGQETKAVGTKHKDDHNVNAVACDDSNDSHATATYDPSADQDDEDDDDYGGRRIMNNAAKHVYEEEDDSKPAAKVSVEEEDSKPAARRRLDMDHEVNHQHQDIIEIDDGRVYTSYATAASHQDDNTDANTSAQDSGFGEYAKYQAAAAPASKNYQSNEQQSPSICGPWQCSICTYLNTTRIWTSAKCEMCDTKRPHGSKLNDGNVAAMFLTID